MSEIYTAQEGSRPRRGIRGILSAVLPTEDRIIDAYPVVETAEYTGPSYDDPAQLADVRRRLEASESSGTI